MVSSKDPHTARFEGSLRGEWEAVFAKDLVNRLGLTPTGCVNRTVARAKSVS